MIKKISSVAIILSLLIFGVSDVVDAKRGGGGKKSHSSYKISKSKKKSVSKPKSSQSKPKSSQSVKKKTENQKDSSNNKTKPKQQAPLPKVLYIATDKGYVFANPNVESKAITSLPKGTPLTPKSMTGVWYQVSFTQNNQLVSGYVSSNITSTSFIPLDTKLQIDQPQNENISKPPVSREVQDRILQGYIEMFKAKPSAVELVVGKNGAIAYGHPNDRNSAVFANLKNGTVVKSDYLFAGWYQVYVTIGNEVAIAYVDGKDVSVNTPK
ncbi:MULTISPECIES: SH3 domain-containing protein [unclassified Brevibacillus]|uniref:SH3 domain-containing protein n=1 Tax=unclassified Brevibacillus TaxID=2684853 RepID=UPI0035672BD9